MCSLIGFGRWNPYYYYILIMNLSKFLKEDILGLNVEFQALLNLSINHHSLLILLLGFTSDFIISLLLWLFLIFKNNRRNNADSFISEDDDSFKNSSTFDKIFEIKDDKNKINDNEETNSLRNDSIFKRENTLKIYLIYNDVISMEQSFSRNSFKFLFLSALFIVLKECITKILYSSNDIFDYYFLNLIIIAIILHVFFKQKLYKHQIFSIFLVSLVSGSFLISCIFVTNNSIIKDENFSFTFTFKDKYHYLIILLIIYIIICILLCTGIIIQKNLMQLKFISSYRILFFKGVIGIFIIIIALIISSNIECDERFIVPEKPPGDFPYIHPSDEEHLDPPPTGEKPSDLPSDDWYPHDNKPRMNNSIMGFEIFSCFIKYENKTYFDNFYEYFESLSKRNTIKEIFILLAYFILHFISEISLILINKFLSPIHYLISESFYTLIHLLYQIITNKLNDNSKGKEEDSGGIYNSISQSEASRILKFVACLFEFFGYSIFMEFIHLNFCGLNRDISKNIAKRAKLESMALEKELDTDYDYNDDSIENSLTYNKK